MQMFTTREDADSEIERLLREGKGNREIMLAVGASSSRVARVRLERGLGNGRLTAGQREEVVRLSAQGMDGAAIARMFNMTRQGVNMLLKRARAGTMKRTNDVVIRDGVAYLTLTRGHTCMVDEADLALVRHLKWSTQETQRNVYAIASKDGYRVLMHRLLCGNPSDKWVDHINHNGLDNRRANLRPVDPHENAHNARRRKDTGLPRGVMVSKPGEYAFQVYVYKSGFKSPEAASEARLTLLEQLHGQDLVVTEKVMPDSDGEAG